MNTENNEPYCPEDGLPVVVSYDFAQNLPEKSVAVIQFQDGKIKNITDPDEFWNSKQGRAIAHNHFLQLLGKLS